MRWNPADKWLFSEQMAHPPIIGKEQFEHARAILAGRGSRTVQGSITTRLTVPRGPSVQLAPGPIMKGVSIVISASPTQGLA